MSDHIRTAQKDGEIEVFAQQAKRFVDLPHFDVRRRHAITCAMSAVRVLRLLEMNPRKREVVQRFGELSARAAHLSHLQPAFPRHVRSLCREVETRSRLENDERLIHVLHRLMTLRGTVQRIGEKIVIPNPVVQLSGALEAL